MHQTEIHPDAVEFIKKKRGSKLHVHDSLDPARTALVVIDMQIAFLKPGLPSEVPVAREIVPNINRLAQSFRAGGGTVVWVYNTFTEAIFDDWSSFLGGTYAPETARAVAERGRPSISAISPKISPAFKVPITLPSATISTRPSLIR